MNTSATARTAGGRGGPATAESGRYLTFTLNGDAFALDIHHVNEILEYRTLTVVPMMPDFIRGVINLRGRAVPIIDLAIRFGRGRTTLKRRTTIVIVRIRSDVGAETDPAAPDARRGDAGGQDIGVLVDAVNKVVTLDADGLEPPPAFGAGIRADYISGMARRDGDFLIVLDVGRVLSISDMLTLSEAAQQHPPAGDDGAGDPGPP